MGIVMLAGNTRLCDFNYDPNQTWDYETTQEQQINTGNTRIYVCKRGRHMWAARGSNRIQTWGKHRANVAESWNLGHTDNSFSLGTTQGVATDGRTIYIANGTNIQTFDASTEPGTQGRTIVPGGAFTGSIRGITFMDRFLWIGNDSDDVFQLDPTDSQAVLKFNAATTVADLCHDGRYIYVYSNRLISSAWILLKFDPDTGNLEHQGRIPTTIPSQGTAYGVTYHGNGHFTCSFFKDILQQRG